MEEIRLSSYLIGIAVLYLALPQLAKTKVIVANQEAKSESLWIHGLPKAKISAEKNKEK